MDYVERGQGQLAAVGLRDDIQQLPALVRFGVQVAVCAGMLFAQGDLPSISFGTELGFEVSSYVLPGLLLLTSVWWINLFNFMDGIDGIAGAQAVFMLLGGAVLSAWINADVMSNPAWILMLCVTAATVGFLLLNWPPAKIFMGDVGSTWLAFMVFALALMSVQTGWLGYATWVVLAAVFVTDATVTLLTRLLRGERWYEAHRNHAYQKLARRWGGAPASHIAHCRHQRAVAGPAGVGLRRVANVGVLVGSVGLCPTGGRCGWFTRGAAGSYFCIKVVLA